MSKHKVLKVKPDFFAPSFIYILQNKQQQQQQKVLSFKQIFKSPRPHQLLLFLLFCFMGRSWEKVNGKAGQGVLPMEDDRHVQAV